MTMREKFITAVVLAPLAALVGILVGQATDSDGEAPAPAAHHARPAAQTGGGSGGGAADEYTLDVPKLNDSR